MDAVCRALEGDADREALRLIVGGIMATDAPSLIADAASRLWLEREEHSKQEAALQRRYEQLSWSDEQKQFLSDDDILRGDEVCGLTDAAYLLGIAVGLRLGPGALKIGGAR